MKSNTEIKMASGVSPLGAWAFALGTSVGWGSLVVTSNTYLAQAGPWGSVLGLILGTVIMVVISKNYAYLIHSFPEPGGAYAYSRDVFGYDHGFLTGWFLALTYFAMKKNVENITLGEMTFTDGGTAATLTGVYDATGATLNADSLIFSKDSRTTMEPGNTMTIVDATGAIKNAKGESLKALTAGTKTSFTNDFTDTVANKGITFTGTHTDTLSQDAAKAKLTYTVGAKNVSTAALAGEIVWNNGGVHYENTKYNFSVDSVTSLKDLAFAAVTADPWGQSMTLIGGNAAGTTDRRQCGGNGYRRAGIFRCFC